MEGHHERKADIACLRLDGWEPDRVRIDEESWGLIERDRKTGRVVGLEYWKPSERLPAELLEVLLAPPARGVVIDRQPG